MNKTQWESQVWESNMNPTAKLIALAVGSHGDWDTGLNVRPTITRLAGMTTFTRGTVSKYVDAMVEQGWLKYVKTHQGNVKEYALAEVVVDTVGILSKPEHQSSGKQLSNLSTTGCRHEEVGLSIVSTVVVDSVDTTLLTLPSNLTNLTSESTAGAVSSLNNEDRVKKWILNRGELQEFERLANLYNVDEADASLARGLLENGRVKGRYESFAKKVEAAFEEVGIEVGEEW